MNFYDTSALMIVHNCYDGERFAISQMSLDELNNIKDSKGKTQEARKNAQSALKFLDNNIDNFEVVFKSDSIIKIIREYGAEVTPDNIIISSALNLVKNGYDIRLISNDIGFRVVSFGVFGIRSFVPNVYSSDVYKGYTLISGDTDHINNMINNFDINSLSVNEYFIIHNKDDDRYSEQRYDGKNLVNLKLPSGIKGKNSLQRCVLDALNRDDVDIVAILGTYGSGKTWLATQMMIKHVLSEKFKKVVGVREPYGEGKEIGFLKGTFDEKIEGFKKPILQQLNGNASVLDTIDFEFTIPFYMKGTTYKDTIILVDEAEDLTESQIKLIGTRLGEDSKIYFAGDYKQSLVDKTESNALVKMCQEFRGNPRFACIFLEEDVRSEASKMFAELF